MNERYGLLVIGGGPAGLAAARAYREAGGTGPVAIVADEGRMPYDRPPLTKQLLRGELAESELPLEDERWLADAGVGLVDGRAVALDAHRHEVVLSGGRTLGYAWCLLATGAEPTRLPLPGSDDPAVRVLRSLDHVRDLQARLRDGGEVVVIGSGFIGCEIAASLRHRGTPVTMVSDELAPNAARLGEFAAARIAGWLRDAGVQLVLGAAVTGITRDRERLSVRTADAELPAAVIVMATGVAARTELFTAAGGTVEAGAIGTDSTMRTALPDVLAAGDACIAENAAAGRRLRVEHWGDALTQGRIAGLSAAGRSAGWDDVPGFWSTIGDATVKYAAWGDGYDAVRVDEYPGGAFTVSYGRNGELVGVLSHQADESYARGRTQIAAGARW